MDIEVSFIPEKLYEKNKPICVLIDVIRASSTIVTLLDKDCERVFLDKNNSDEIFLNLKEKNKNLLICAENLNGSKHNNADFSPSILEIEKFSDFENKEVLLKSTNGTKGINMLINQGAEEILVGCMMNAESVMEKAIQLSSKLNKDINIVCAGRDRGTSYTIDDVYCSAKLIGYAKKIADKKNIKINLQDSAKMAEALLLKYDNVLEAFVNSASGYVMNKINCTKDIELCARDSISNTVPIVNGLVEDGFIEIKKLS